MAIVAMTVAAAAFAAPASPVTAAGGPAIAASLVATLLTVTLVPLPAAALLRITPLLAASTGAPGAGRPRPAAGLSVLGCAPVPGPRDRSGPRSPPRPPRRRRRRQLFALGAGLSAAPLEQSGRRPAFSGGQRREAAVPVEDLHGHPGPSSRRRHRPRHRSRHRRLRMSRRRRQDRRPRVKILTRGRGAHEARDTGVGLRPVEAAAVAEA